MSDNTIQSYKGRELDLQMAKIYFLYIKLSNQTKLSKS